MHLDSTSSNLASRLQSPSGHWVQFYRTLDYACEVGAQMAILALQRGAGVVLLVPESAMAPLLDRCAHLLGTGLPGPDFLRCVASDRLLQSCRSTDGTYDEDMVERLARQPMLELLNSRGSLFVHSHISGSICSQAMHPAFRLEQNWSASCIQSRSGIWMQCMYPLQSFDTPSSIPNFDKVCSLHEFAAPAEFDDSTSLACNPCSTTAALQQRSLVLDHEAQLKRQLEAKLVQRERDVLIARAAADVASSAKNDFLALVSHELRTPLVAISGYADMVARNLEARSTPALSTSSSARPAPATLAFSSTDDADREALAIVKHSAQHLSRLLDDLLDLARMQCANQLGVRPERVDIRAVASDACAMNQMAALAAGVDLKMEVASDVPHWITTDGFRLRQILMHLLSNAIKFSRPARPGEAPAFAKLQISVGATARSKSSMSPSASSSRTDLAAGANPSPKSSGNSLLATPLGAPDEPMVLRCLVVDNGIGMDSATASHLFQTFTQGDVSITRAFGGVGVGLVMARALSRLLGGDIALVDSTPDQGSTFMVSVRGSPAFAKDGSPFESPRHANVQLTVGNNEQDVPARALIEQKPTAVSV